MSNELHQHSIRPSKPVDPSFVGMLRLVDRVARELECAYFVAGATARDLVLVNVYGLRPGRATRDIDFGIAVESWEQFRLLKERLIATGKFAADRWASQRLIYTDRSTGVSIPVDLIPFRGVASATDTIAWPPSRDTVLNVAGFEEALASSVSMELEEGFPVRVASVVGLALLKLIAWADRGSESNKDAADLYRLLTAYADAGNTDRLYDHELVLLQAAGFDMELAGAELLGRDIASLASPSALNHIRSVVKSERDVERLINQVGRVATFGEETSRVEQTVIAFCRGVLDVR